jgi:16S rRNA (cytosine967-C5)-methyltransferase
MSAPPRLLAAQAVAAVAGGSSLDAALATALHDAAAADVSLIKAVAYGVLRERRLLEWLAAQLLQKPLNKEPVLHALLLGGLYQLRSMRVAEHAAVGETVAAAAALNKAWAKGLLNAVLRRYQRERAALEAAVPEEPALRLSYPDWLAQAIRADWGERTGALLAAGNVPGPMTLRVNRNRIDRDAYRAVLAAAGIAAQPLPAASDALRLDTPCNVGDLPGFAGGQVSVQDAAAQLAADILDPQPGERILDACAAPGGKTAHLLERCRPLDVLALDSDAQRLARVGETLRRLGLDAALCRADAGEAAAWWDGRPFDRILLDAPCSGSGVIRRHPDIKWLRRASDIPALAAGQRRLLAALWPALKPGGVLVYATCSILSAEGDAVIQDFLAAQPGARAQPLGGPWGEATPYGCRIVPGGDYDGFYYARLLKEPG